MKFLLSLLLCLTLHADVLLVIQRDIPIEAAPHFDRWQSQVESEGHKVTRLFGPKANWRDTNQVLNFASNHIWPWVRANTNGFVWFVGDLPMPRTGQTINPDGHLGSSGAYAATSFYAAPDETWTDVRDNSGLKPRSTILNVPGDGKFDQQTLLNPPRARVGWFNPWYSPRTFNITNSTQSEYVVDVLRRYFDLNIRWRTGQLTAERIGIGADDGRFNAGLVAWATEQVGDSNVVTFNRTESYFVKLPFLLDRDFKGFTESSQFWGRQATGALFSGLDLTYGSYQVDYMTQRTWFPGNCGALATGNMGSGWDLSNWQTKTLGELWEQTVVQFGRIYINLYGDPTLRLKP